MSLDNKYVNSKIYQITDNAYTNCYIGSTYSTLAKRMSQHRDDYNRYIIGKIAQTCSYDIFDEFGVENCKIELVESYPCESRDDLNKCEGYWIRETQCVNRVMTGRTRHQYREDNRDTIAEHKKEYAATHKDVITASQKSWAQGNKEHVNAKSNAWYHANSEKCKERVTCECGTSVIKRIMHKHLNSNNHTELMEAKTNV